jgi:hypothetical protein
MRGWEAIHARPSPTPSLGYARNKVFSRLSAVDLLALFDFWSNIRMVHLVSVEGRFVAGSPEPLRGRQWRDHR